MEKIHMVIPIFIPHRGCPFDCIYCNQKIISGQVGDITPKSAISIIESHLTTVKDDTYVEIAFYGGSFTGLAKDEQKSFLNIAQQYVNKSKINGIRLSTRPDYIDNTILEMLSQYSVKTIELGVQSLNEDVLKKSCRGHGVKEVYTASKLIKDYGFELGIQTMIGLPGDTKQKDIFTAKKAIEIMPSVVRIYPALVIKGTYMEKMYNRGEFTPLTLDEAVDICAELMDIYKNKEIKVLRVGLQATESINANSDVVAGPFHPAFRQLVHSRMFLKKIEDKLVGMEIPAESVLEIHSNKKFISDIVGQKRYNVNYLKNKYGLKGIKVISDDVDETKLLISIVKKSIM